jgi:hypothetical protein
MAPAARLVVDGYTEDWQHDDVDPRPFSGQSMIWFGPQTNRGQIAIRPNSWLMGCKEAVMIGTRIAEKLFVDVRR